MYRTWILSLHTFKQSIVQPIFGVLLAVTAAVLMVFALLPFFTLGEDSIMYRAVSLDLVLLTALLLTLFSASRSVFEEIEDRTMLTLMSKPVSKLEVLAGKFLGLSLSAALAIVLLGVVTAICLWYRIPGDYRLAQVTLNESIAAQLSGLRAEMLVGISAELLVTWLQVSVLTAVAVAISTRFSLVVTLPAVLLLYIGGNLSRFIPTGEAGLLALVGEGVKTLLPFLAVFDIRALTTYSDIAVPGTIFAAAEDGTLPFGAVSMVEVLGATGVAIMYAGFYCVFALAFGLLLFQNRELGGSE